MYILRMKLQKQKEGSQATWSVSVRGVVLTLTHLGQPIWPTFRVWVAPPASDYLNGVAVGLQWIIQSSCMSRNKTTPPFPSSSITLYFSISFSFVFLMQCICRVDLRSTLLVNFSIAAVTVLCSQLQKVPCNLHIGGLVVGRSRNQTPTVAEFLYTSDTKDACFFNRDLAFHKPQKLLPTNTSHTCIQTKLSFFFSYKYFIYQDIIFNYLDCEKLKIIFTQLFKKEILLKNIITKPDFTLLFFIFFEIEIKNGGSRI